MGVGTRPRVICFYHDRLPERQNDGLLSHCDCTTVDDTSALLRELSSDNVQGLFVPASSFSQLEHLLQKDRVLNELPQGVTLLDPMGRILWSNRQLQIWAGDQIPDEGIQGTDFYIALSSPEILGPDFCPFATALATGQAASSLLRTVDNRYFDIHAVPVIEHEELPESLVVTITDITAEKLQQERLETIHTAGIELADLSPEEVFHMELEDRIELLKSNILHHTKNLLNYDVIEVRLLDHKSQVLTPLLSVGLTSDASQRQLCAQATDNGVTGFVATTGKSYLCEDTTEDPLYIEGFEGAKSSMTVPLIWHDEVIGTFNVESPEARAFHENDLKFLEIYVREIALALNTLELLVAQKANAAQQSVEAIHSEVAIPVDEILNDAVNVMEQYIGHEPQVSQRLQRILRNARDIKQVIQKVGQRLAPAEAVPSGVKIDKHPKLRSVRVLVVDADESVRNDAHALLERYGCIVETAHSGREAVLMVRSCEQVYDVVISDIRLDDMNGHELMCTLQQLVDSLPMILMSGFGYDPAHTIVKARRAGLSAKAILYKPFRLDQLLGTVETVLETHAQANAP